MVIIVVSLSCAAYHYGTLSAMRNYAALYIFYHGLFSLPVIARQRSIVQECDANEAEKIAAAWFPKKLFTILKL